MDFITIMLTSAAALGLWFWALAAVAFIALMVSVESEKFYITTPIAIIGIGLLMWVSGFAPFEWVKSNVGTLASWIGIYLVVGIIWGVVKWFFYLMRIRDTLVAFREKKGIEKGNKLTEEQLKEYRNYYAPSGDSSSISIPPRAAESKKRITFWMIYWPFSMPWTLMNEPIKRFFNFVYNRIAGFLQGMSDRMFKDMA